MTLVRRIIRWLFESYYLTALPYGKPIDRDKAKQLLHAYNLHNLGGSGIDLDKVVTEELCDRSNN